MTINYDSFRKVLIYKIFFCEDIRSTGYIRLDSLSVEKNQNVALSMNLYAFITEDLHAYMVEDMLDIHSNLTGEDFSILF